MDFQRTVNSVLTVCLSPGDNPNVENARFVIHDENSLLVGRVFHKTYSLFSATDKYLTPRFDYKEHFQDRT